MATVVIAGATGFLGRTLVQTLRQRGDRVVAVVRNTAHARQRFGSSAELAGWDDRLATVIAGADAVVNFCGENIAGGRWTQRRKAILRSSRLEPTRRLVEAIAAAEPAPRVLINASAVGYYGNRGDELLSDDSPKGIGFLSDLCAAWEDTACQAEPFCRVVRLRIGVVLGSGGGMLGKLEPIVSTVGAIIPGSGRQWLSWVALADVMRAIEWIIERDSIAGALNIVAPQPVTMATFMRTLARRYHRPVYGRVPELVLRLVLGEMACTLTDSTRAYPGRLLSAGFEFMHTDLPSALEH